jgi:RNA polymerase sigma-70 factor (ECF subfamily)
VEQTVGQITPSSLLMRLRQPGGHQAWTRFVELYAPLLYDWARRFHLQPADASDLVQDVFVILVRKLPDFVYDPGKRFRGWLWTVVCNAWRSHLRKARRGPRPDAADPDELAAPEVPPEMEEQEYRQHLISRALRLVRDDFQPMTWKAFEEHVIAGRPAAELGVSVNAVHLARSRVLRRLRMELEGLLD